MVACLMEGENVKKFKNAFDSCYRGLKNGFITEIKQLGIDEPATTWIDEMCDYNVIGGKMNRGISVVETGALMHDGVLPEKEFEAFVALGWCIEWLQASFLIADDIMDSSLTRRGQKCWYRKERVGMVAINDCFVLHSMIFKTLKGYFDGGPSYVPLVELFIDTKMRTELGQLLDLLTAPADSNQDEFTMNRLSAPADSNRDEFTMNRLTAPADSNRDEFTMNRLAAPSGKNQDEFTMNKLVAPGKNQDEFTLDRSIKPSGRNLANFTMDLYRKIVRFKTAYYSFYLPVVSALIAGGHKAEATSLELESFLVDLGELFQIQDDYLDCFGDPLITGKVGTDILEGKCTWLVVKALESPKLTSDMRADLDKHYGSKSTQSEEIIKIIYQQLNLQAEFKTFEDAFQLGLTERIKAIASRNVKLGNVLESFAKRIFGRQK